MYLSTLKIFVKRFVHFYAEPLYFLPIIIIIIVTIIIIIIIIIIFVTSHLKLADAL